MKKNNIEHGAVVLPRAGDIITIGHEDAPRSFIRRVVDAVFRRKASQVVRKYTVIHVERAATGGKK